MDARPQRVRVPASTSNLGPGFDCLGAALSLYVEVQVVEQAEQHRFGTLEGEAKHWPLEDNLLTKAFDLGRDSTGGGFVFDVTSDVPISRGLGSSAAAVAAGLLLGAKVADSGASRDELLARGIAVEGHPDNIAPALLGGCRVCVPLEGGARVFRQPVHSSLGWALAWPEVEVSTEVARSSLPKEVRFRDAVENPRRLALLLEGLRTGDGELLRHGIEDRLHAAYRLALVPGASRVLAAAREAGAYAATVSGSGSAHVALTPKDRAAEVAEAMASAWRERGGEGTGAAVELVDAAPVVE